MQRILLLLGLIAVIALAERALSSRVDRSAVTGANPAPAISDPDPVQERSRLEKAAARVVGVDEVGRSPVAGDPAPAVITVSADPLSQLLWRAVDAAGIPWSKVQIAVTQVILVPAVEPAETVMVWTDAEGQFRLPGRKDLSPSTRRFFGGFRLEFPQRSLCVKISRNTMSLAYKADSGLPTEVVFQTWRLLASGRVVDDAGQPLAGVSVAAGELGPLTQIPVLSDESVNGYDVTRWMSASHGATAPSYELSRNVVTAAGATTLADGSFEISGHFENETVLVWTGPVGSSEYQTVPIGSGGLLITEAAR